MLPEQQDMKRTLDSLIEKSRVHFYKPIQIAEILYKYRVDGSESGIDFLDKNTYRNRSKKWRDVVTRSLVGNVSTSSARYQDNVFDENAIPPSVLSRLAVENEETAGAVEAYIYRRLSEKLSLLTSGVDYCQTHDRHTFCLDEFLNIFWERKGLKRSIDKVYECVVYALVASIVRSIEAEITLSYNSEKRDIIRDFEDFARSVMNISLSKEIFQTEGTVHRIGATNAADRGLDIWTNFGVIVQIKHITLKESEARRICDAVTADRIVIVCRDSEKGIIESILGQVGWQSRIQSIITRENLVEWYDRALRGKFSSEVGDDLLQILVREICKEFPATEKENFVRFCHKRNYDSLPKDDVWLPEGGNIFSSL